MKKKALKFDKDLFKRSVQYNVKTLYRKTMEEATEQELYQAAAYAIKDAIVDHWMTTQKKAAEQDPKIVYYMSMEFLMGRAYPLASPKSAIFKTLSLVINKLPGFKSR